MLGGGRGLGRLCRRGGVLGGVGGIATGAVVGLVVVVIERTGRFVVVGRLERIEGLQFHLS